MIIRVPDAGGVKSIARTLVEVGALCGPFEGWCMRPSFEIIRMPKDSDSIGPTAKSGGSSMKLGCTVRG